MRADESGEQGTYLAYKLDSLVKAIGGIGDETVNIRDLSDGDMIVVHTEHSTYLMSVLEKDSGKVSVVGSGGTFRDVTTVWFTGSTPIGGTMLVSFTFVVGMTVELLRGSLEKDDFECWHLSPTEEVWVNGTRLLPGCVPTPTKQ